MDFLLPSMCFTYRRSQDSFEKLEKAGATPVIADMGDAARSKEITEGMDAVSFFVPFFPRNPADGLQYAKNAVDATVLVGPKQFVWNSGFILPQKIGNLPLDSHCVSSKESGPVSSFS